MSPTRWFVVFGIWLAMAIWACRHAWVARQARGHARALFAVTMILLGCGDASGRAIVTATLNGVTGSDSVVVLPHLQAVELSTDRTTVHVGDTVTFAAVIRTASGATLEGLHLVWELSDHTRARFTGAGDRVVAMRTGTVGVTATIARTTLTILRAATP